MFIRSQVEIRVQRTDFGLLEFLVHQTRVKSHVYGNIRREGSPFGLMKTVLMIVLSPWQPESPGN